MLLFRRVLLTVLALTCITTQAEWSVVQLVDDFGDPTGDQVAVIKITHAVPRTAVLRVNKHFVDMKFSYLNLMRDGVSGDHLVRIRIQDKTYRLAGTSHHNEVLRAAFLLEQRKWRRLIVNAVKNEAEEIKISLNYYRHGRISLVFPLTGACKVFIDVGLLKAGECKQLENE